jgi:succinate dehydrogenase/fumarate reductase flavoprotein subunit
VNDAIESIPDLVGATAVPQWHDDCDVAIVGFGVAGACAAIEAKRAGATVTVLERASEPGGTSALAGGHFYLGGGTPVQRACGFEDTPDDMYEYLVAVTADPEREKIRAYCNGSVGLFSWLETNGVCFDRSYYADKHVIQPGRDCLIWSGNEKVWPFREKARPAPRGHKVATDGDGGPHIVGALCGTAEGEGACSHYDTAVTALVVDDDRRVMGVRTQQFGEVGYTHAARAVVLTAGGFVMNRELVTRFARALADPVIPVGAPYDDGLGIMLGYSAGGALRHMDGAFVSVTNYPPSVLLKSVLVNTAGTRFVAEDSYHARTSAACMAQPEGKAYLIADSETFAYPEFRSMPFIDRWDTLAEAEHALGLPERSLQHTIDTYNEHARHGDDPSFHKDAEWLQPLDRPPYAAFDASLGVGVYVGFTVGGLRTALDGEVLDEEGNAIPGLFAAGACASSIVQDSLGYNSGICLGEAAFFGRRAGRRAGSS